MKRSKKLLCSVVVSGTLAIAMSNVGYAQSSKGKPAQERKVDLTLDSSPEKCQKNKDACGGITKRQKALLIAICDTFQRRGSNSMRAELNKSLKGKSCAQSLATAQVHGE